MNSTADDNDEINLLQLLGTVIRHKRIVLTVTALAIIIIPLFSLISIILPPEYSYLPNQYSPKATMLINDTSSSGGSMSSMLSSSGLSGLASLAGVNVSGGNTYSALAVYIASSENFLDTVVDKFSLVKRYKIKKFKRADSRKALLKKLSASFDEDSGVFTISFTDYDPVFAQGVVNFCVEYMEKRFTEMGLDKNKLQKANLESNIKSTYEQILALEAESRRVERSASYATSAAGLPSVAIDSTRIKAEVDIQEQVYAQLKIQYELLKVTMASETPVFQVLQYADVPDKKSGPSRGLLCVIVIFSAFFGSIILVFALDAISKIRSDPEALASLKGEKQ
jgi:uncharacterized protein involved in exopolysaccharide biosynthesis